MLLYIVACYYESVNDILVSLIICETRQTTQNPSWA